MGAECTPPTAFCPPFRTPWVRRTVSQGQVLMQAAAGHVGGRGPTTNHPQKGWRLARRAPRAGATSASGSPLPQTVPPHPAAAAVERHTLRAPSTADTNPAAHSSVLLPVSTPRPPGRR